MSWNDFFPQLDDAMVAAYVAEASEVDKARVGEMFATEAVHNRQGNAHVLSTSLFWKPEVANEEDFPVPTKEVMQDPAGNVLRSRFANPWQHYVAPVMDMAANLRSKGDEVTLRVYLAQDLDFLIPELVEAGCEVHLMKSSSVRHNPGAMWRFLAMEDARMVTVTDADRARDAIHDIRRTELVTGGGLKFWRIPYFPGGGEEAFSSPAPYRTMIAGQFGASINLPMRLLAEAFLWNVEQGRMRDYWTVGEKKIPIFKAKWPNYGFNEFFLNAVVYPRVVRGGVLTLVGWNNDSYNYWFALDIKNCTRANPQSEILYFGDPKADQVHCFNWSEGDLKGIEARLRQGEKPILSVCVSLKNRSRIAWKSDELILFPNCVKCLAKVASVVGPIELVVADFSSDDWPLEEWLAAAAGVMSVRVVSMDGDFSKGRGLNAAVNEAQSENILLFDVDIVIDESAFVAGLHFLAKGRAFFPIIKNLDEAGNDDFWNHPGTGISFVKKAVFETAGGVPEFRSWGGEDDLFYQSVKSSSPIERMKLEGIVHQWHPESCRYENYEGRDREDFITYVAQSDSRPSYHSLKCPEGLGSYRVFQGNHPAWAGSVRLSEGERFARQGVEGGTYELFEKEELRLVWQEKAEDRLRWDLELGCDANEARDFTMREVVGVNTKAKKPLRVACEGMWTTFDMDQLNAGFRMLPYYFMESHLPDLIICGPWCDPEEVSRKWPGVRTLFFTGENVAPAGWRDFNIGFHRGSEGESYLRWPLFLFYFYWKFDGARTLLKKDVTDWHERPGFMSFVARNSNCGIRNQFAELLRKDHEIACPGETLNNMPLIGPDGVDKQRFLSKYRFKRVPESRRDAGSVFGESDR
jgi:glycosyltransferase involved in cell wall biosynthesis